MTESFIELIAKTPPSRLTTETAVNCCHIVRYDRTPKWMYGEKSTAPAASESTLQWFPTVVESRITGLTGTKMTVPAASETTLNQITTSRAVHQIPESTTQMRFWACDEENIVQNWRKKFAAGMYVKTITNVGSMPECSKRQ